MELALFCLEQIAKEALTSKLRPGLSARDAGDGVRRQGPAIHRRFLEPVGCALASDWEKGQVENHVGQVGCRAVRIHDRPGYPSRQCFAALHSATQHRRSADTQSILRIGLQHIVSCLYSDLFAKRFIAREH